MKSVREVELHEMVKADFGPYHMRNTDPEPRLNSGSILFLFGDGLIIASNSVGILSVEGVFDPIAIKPIMMESPGFWAARQKLRKKAFYWGSLVVDYKEEVATFRSPNSELDDHEATFIQSEFPHAKEYLTIPDHAAGKTLVPINPVRLKTLLQAMPESITQLEQVGTHLRLTCTHQERKFVGVLLGITVS
jgi:hypothetical protein